MQRVHMAMVAAEIHPSDDPEINRVLAGELDDDDADWIVDALDDVAAQVSNRYGLVRAASVGDRRSLDFFEAPDEGTERRLTSYFICSR